MKKTIIFGIIFLGLFGITSGAIVDNAISRMYDNGLTIHNNKTNFNADRGLRRDEAAKFYVNFAKLLGLGESDYIKSDSQCLFSDINQSWSDLRNVVIESCKLGLLQGNKGKFYPQNQLTNAEAITILIRLLDGWKDEISVNHWADNYYKKANELGIIENVSMNIKNNIANRGNVGIIIYNGNILNENRKNTENWQIYTHPLMGRKISFPPNWYYQELDDFFVKFSSVDPGQNKYMEYPTISFRIYQNPQKLSLEDFFKQDTVIHYFEQVIGGVNDIIIKDIPSKEFKVSGMYQSNTIILIPKDDLIIEFSDSGDMHQKDQIFDNMVQSIEF